MRAHDVLDRPYAPANAQAWTAFVCGLVCLAIVVRVALPAPILDLYWNYTQEGGGFVEKLHPMSVAIIGLFPLMLLTMRIELDRWSYRAALALCAFGTTLIALMAYLAASGLAGSAGYILDSYVSAVLGALCLLAFTREQRARISELVVIVLVISALIGVFEVITHIRVIPYGVREPLFRPTGLAGHPLLLGLLSVTAIPFVAVGRWSTATKIVAICILFLGAGAANARIAQLAATAAMMAAAFALPLPGRSRTQLVRLRALLVVAGIVGLTLALIVLGLGGFLDRLASGLVDRSSMARVDVYRLFEMTSWSEILFGTDMARIVHLAETQLRLEAIESSVVIFVFQFGLFGAILFAMAFAIAVVRLATPSRWAVPVGCVLFFLVAMSNNALSIKTPAVLVLLVLLIGANAARPAAPARGRLP